MQCPLCGAEGPLSRPAWSRPVDYADQRFEYVRCRDCGSLTCHPMPDEPTLQRMYGGEYALTPGAPLDIDDPRVDDWVCEELAALPPGLFVDYGCGAGALLQRAAGLGWDVLGIELSPEVVADVREATGFDVVTPDQIDGWAGRAAVVHLGDVIEHLATPVEDLTAIVRLLAPHGTLLAQGPLEGNTSVFQYALRLSGWLRRGRPTNWPPYHVLLASALGQMAIFRRAGLTPERWLVTEVSWPAPSRLHQADLGNPRTVALFLLRRASAFVSNLAGHDWGNRYLYRGRLAVDRGTP